MNNGWITCFLGEICDVTTGRRPNVKTNYPSNEMNIPVYGGNGIAWYTNEFLLNIDSPVILTGRVGTLGTYFRVVGKCWVSDNALIIIPRTVDPDFLYYYMKMLPIESLNRGSTQPLLTQSDLKQIRLFIPKDIKEQKKISNVLKILDAKIELNTDINKNLEEQAQALFKSWFIDFEPFDGKRPEDWEQGCLLDIARYLNGLAMQKFRPTPNEENIPVLKIKELRQGFCDSNSDLCSANIDSSYIVEDGDVIFSWSGSLLVDIWCGGRAGLNQHLFKVSSNKYDKWFYYSWTKYHLDHFISVAADKATTMGHIKRNELEKAEVIIPSSIYLQKIGQIIAPMYDLIIKNRIENSRLAALRDALLPKLMSGEIDVSKVDISDPDYVEKLSFSGA